MAQSAAAAPTAPTPVPAGKRTAAILLCKRAMANSPEELTAWALRVSAAVTPTGVATYCLCDGAFKMPQPANFIALAVGAADVVNKHIGELFKQQNDWGDQAAVNGGAVRRPPPHFQDEFTEDQWRALAEHLELLLDEPAAEDDPDDATPDCSDPDSGKEPDLPPSLSALTTLASQPKEIVPRIAPEADAKLIFDSQRHVAKCLFDRIKTCMRDLGAPLEQFSELDFRILTAGFNTLKEQTVRRLEGLAPNDQFPLPGGGDAAARLVMIYGTGAEQRESFASLRTSAFENPTRLHVLIADEAHWGTTRGGWNSFYVNDAKGTTLEHKRVPAKEHGDGALLALPNVIVLLVTATPYNLLSRMSRVPNRNSPAHGDDYHVVSWDEQVLVAPQPNQQTQSTAAPTPVLKCRLATYFRHTGEGEVDETEYLAVLAMAGAASGWSLGTCVGTEGAAIVGIFEAEEPGEHCIAFRVSDKWVWLAVGTELELVDERTDAAMFRVHQEHGYSVAAYELILTGQYIMVSTNTGVTLGDRDDLHRLGWQFFVRPVLDGGGKVYKSLNYYFNTMRQKADDRQLIRTDRFLESIIPKSTTSGGLPKLSYRELAADYAYSILYFRVFYEKDCLLETVNEAPTVDLFLSKNSDWYIRRFAELDDRAREFHQRFGSLARNVPIAKGEPLDLFAHFIVPYRKRIQRDLEGVLSSTVATNSKEGQLRLWSALKHEPTVAQNPARFKQVCDLLRNALNQNQDEAAAQFRAARSETEILIEDLIVKNTKEVNGKRVMSGPMKIVRIFQENLATHFYFAVLLAADIAKFRHTFCILRDYSKFDISESFRPPLASGVVSAGPSARSSGVAAAGETSEYAFWTKLLTRPDGAPETWVPDQYEHLDRLPCILVLVQKGRMGDTFPNSFNCMDIRLSYSGNSKVELSTLVQELGRLCRYAPADASETKLPYAIVSGVLHGRLSSALEKSLSLALEFSRYPDGYLKLAPGALGRTEIPRRWQHLDPIDKHYDHVPLGDPPRDPHARRFVLVAEPQIGKTGTYLALLKLLATAVGARPWFVMAPSFLENPLLPEPRPDDPASVAIWEYPHWRLMQQFAPAMADQEISKGKYDAKNPVRPGRPWHYGLVFPKSQRTAMGNAILPDDAAGGATSTRGRQGQDGGDNDDDGGLNVDGDGPGRAGWRQHSTEYVSSKYPHEAHLHTHTCDACTPSRGDGTALVQLQLSLDQISALADQKYSFAGQSTTPVWLPPTLRLADVVVAEGEARATGEFEPRAVLEARTVHYWILTPSARPSKARLNLHHALDGKTAEQIVFCRRAHVDAFKERWGRRKIIIVLPDRMVDRSDSDAGEDELTVEMGVGFARLFMQLFAEAFEMPFVFLIDDNLFHMAELTLPLSLRNVASPSSRVYAAEPCSLGTVLAHLQTPAWRGSTAPAPTVAYTFADASATTPSIVDVTATTLEAYMGPIANYGLLGTFRCDLLTVSAAPFKRGHVYSLVLLNVNATKAKNVRFKALPFWEDLNFNEQCDRKGLFVCKFNRFIQLKRWQPLPGERAGADRILTPAPPTAAGAAGLYDWPPHAIVRWDGPHPPLAIDAQSSALRTVLDRFLTGLDRLVGLAGAHVVVSAADYFDGLRSELLEERRGLGAARTVRQFSVRGVSDVAAGDGSSDQSFVLVSLMHDVDGRRQQSWTTDQFLQTLARRLIGNDPGQVYKVALLLSAVRAADTQHFVYDWAQLFGDVSRALRGLDTSSTNSSGAVPQSDRHNGVATVAIQPQSFHVQTIAPPAALSAPTLLLVQFKLEHLRDGAAMVPPPRLEDMDLTPSKRRRTSGPTDAVVGASPVRPPSSGTPTLDRFGLGAGVVAPQTVPTTATPTDSTKRARSASALEDARAPTSPAAGPAKVAKRSKPTDPAAPTADGITPAQQARRRRAINLFRRSGLGPSESLPTHTAATAAPGDFEMEGAYYTPVAVEMALNHLREHEKAYAKMRRSRRREAAGSASSSAGGGGGGGGGTDGASSGLTAEDLQMIHDLTEGIDGDDDEGDDDNGDDDSEDDSG